MKKRYVRVTNRRRVHRETTAAKIGCTRSMAVSVPVKSQGMFSTPPATAISSRMGRIT